MTSLTFVSLVCLFEEQPSCICSAYKGHTLRWPAWANDTYLVFTVHAVLQPMLDPHPFAWQIMAILEPVHDALFAKSKEVWNLPLSNLLSMQATIISLEQEAGNSLITVLLTCCQT